MTWDYDRIKATAKEMRGRGESCTIRDLCALDPSNDPFYTGRPKEIRDAEWFAELWRRLGYTENVHLRRVHYEIASQREPVELPTRLTWTDKRTREKHATTEYLNVERCWQFLTNAGKWARYLELVPMLAFDDRRNPEPKVYTNWTRPGDLWYRDPTPRYSVEDDLDWSGYTLPGLPELPPLRYRLPELPVFVVEGYKGIQQPYHVELWCEKTTMNDVLIPVCREHDVNLITGTGEMSITAVADFVERARAASRPAQILYVSDYDDKGRDMPVSVARKVEFLQRERGYNDLDVKLDHIVLTEAQIDRYELPHAPGDLKVELDALEALHKGELGRIVEQGILRYHDPELEERARARRRELVEALTEAREDVVARHKAEYDALTDDYSTLRGEFDQARREFAELVEGFQERLDEYDAELEGIVGQGKALARKVVEDLEAVYVDAGGEYPLPDPKLAEGNGSALYASGRDYLSQLEQYKEYRNTTVDNDN